MAGSARSITIQTSKKTDRLRILERKFKNSNQKKLPGAIEEYKAIAAEIKPTSCIADDEDYLSLIKSIATSTKALNDAKRHKEAGDFLKWAVGFIEKTWLKPDIARFSIARFSFAPNSELMSIAKSMIKLSLDLRALYLALAELQPFDYSLYRDDMKNIAEGMNALFNSDELLIRGRFPCTQQTKLAREFFLKAGPHDIALSMIQIINKIQMTTLHLYLFVPADFKEGQLNLAYLEQITAADYIDTQDMEQEFSAVEKLCESTALLTDKEYDAADKDLTLNRNNCLIATDRTLSEAMHHLAKHQTFAETYLVKFARHYLANLHKVQNKQPLVEHHITIFEPFCAGLTAFYETKDIQAAQKYFIDASAIAGTIPWDCIEMMKSHVAKKLGVIANESKASAPAAEEKKATAATPRQIASVKVAEFKALECLLITPPLTPLQEQQAVLASYKTVALEIFSPESCEATATDPHFSKFITSIRVVSKKLRDEKQTADACSLLEWAVKTIEDTWLKPEIARFSLPLSGEPVMTEESIPIHFLSLIRDELYLKLKELNPVKYEMRYKNSHRILIGMTTLLTHAHHHNRIIKCSTPQATALAKASFKGAHTTASDDIALQMLRIVEKFQITIAEKHLIKKAADFKEDQINAAYEQHMLTVQYIDEQGLENVPTLIVQFYESVNILTDKKSDTANESRNTIRFNLLLKTCRVITESILLLTLEEGETNLKAYALTLANAYLSLIKKMEAQRHYPKNPIAVLEDFCKGLEAFFVPGDIKAAHAYFVSAQTKTSETFLSIKNMEARAKKILNDPDARVAQLDRELLAIIAGNYGSDSKTEDNDLNIPEELKKAEDLFKSGECVASRNHYNLMIIAISKLAPHGEPQKSMMYNFVQSVVNATSSATNATNAAHAEHLLRTALSTLEDGLLLPCLTTHHPENQFDRPTNDPIKLSELRELVYKNLATLNGKNNKAYESSLTFSQGIRAFYIEQDRDSANAYLSDSGKNFATTICAIMLKVVAEPIEEAQDTSSSEATNEPAPKIRRTRRGRQRNKPKGSSVLTPPTNPKPAPKADEQKTAPAAVPASKEEAPKVVAAAPIAAAAPLPPVSSTEAIPKVVATAADSALPKKETITQRLKRLAMEHQEAQVQKKRDDAKRHHQEKRARLIASRNQTSVLAPGAAGEAKTLPREMKSLATPATLLQENKNPDELNHWMKESFIPTCESKTIDSVMLLGHLDNLFPDFKDENTYKKSRWLGQILRQLNQDKTGEPLTKLYFAMQIEALVNTVNCSNAKENMRLLSKENPLAPSHDLLLALATSINLNPAMHAHFGNDYHKSPAFLLGLSMVLTHYKAHHQPPLPQYAAKPATFLAAVQRGVAAKTAVVSAPTKTRAPA